MEKNKYHIVQPLLFAIMIAMGMWIGSAVTGEKTKVIFKNEASAERVKLGRVGEVIRYISNKYVDSIDAESLSSDAIEAIFSHLDPHSFFIQPKQLESVNEKMAGSYEGLGIQYAMYNDTMYVMSILQDGPAFYSELEVGDKIISIDNKSIAGKNISSDSIRAIIKSNDNSEVSLGVLRSCQDFYNSIEVEKGDVPDRAVPHSTLLNENTAYIALRTFNSKTTQEFLDSLYALNADEGTYNLIIDLRGNPGGYLRHAINIMSQLIDKRDETIVFTEGYRSGKKEYSTSGRKYFDFNDVFILVDENSASASEIVAGAIQDYDRGTIIGRRTYGKGLVQDQLKLSDGSAIRLTVSRYYTPSGRLIQRSYEGDLRDAYTSSFNNRWERGELFDEEKIPTGDTTEYFTRGGRKVQGGMGIIPDIFIPLDSTMYLKEYSEVRNKLEPAVLYLAKCELAGNLSSDTISVTKALQKHFPNLYSVLDMAFSDNKDLKETFWKNINIHFNSLVLRINSGRKAEMDYRLSKDPYIDAVRTLLETEN